MTPAVTVLMPVYNGLPHLKPAIESILAQTFTDFEFLIINDASTDESVACIKSYGDPRIRLIENNPNLGTARTMNRGIELARAEYIARLDQDDVSMPRRLEAQLAYMRERPHLDITCTWEYGLNHDGERLRNWRTSVDDDGGFLGPLLVGKCPIWHPSIMFKRQAMLDAGGFDPSMSPVEDFETTMRMALKGKSAGVVPEYLVGQRDHAARQSVTKYALQWKRTQDLHDAMLARFTDGTDVAGLGSLLRLEDAWWRRASSKADVVALIRGVETTLDRVGQDLSLTSAEMDTMRKVVYGRLGPGVKWAGALAAFPAAIVYAALFTGSPLLIPGLRPFASALNERVRRLRYAGRTRSFVC